MWLLEINVFTAIEIAICLSAMASALTPFLLKSTIKLSAKMINLGIVSINITTILLASLLAGTKLGLCGIVSSCSPAKNTRSTHASILPELK